MLRLEPSPTVWQQLVVIVIVAAAVDTVGRTFAGSCEAVLGMQPVERDIAAKSSTTFGLLALVVKNHHHSPCIQRPSCATCTTAGSRPSFIVATGQKGSRSQAASFP